MLPDPNGRRKRGDGGDLTVPDVAGSSLHEAALAYAEAGWYVLPTDPNDIKNPGSVVMGKWQEQSSRDPDQIRRWWTANPDYGIALHCGRSGAIVFDLDVGSMNAVRVIGRDDIADALLSAGAIQGTRRDSDRGHYIFLMPTDHEFGNGAGVFAMWGEVRGKNGVIVAAPTPHPDADTKDGNYNQRKTGRVGPLPDVLRECLTPVERSAEPLTDAQLDVFLDTHTGSGGCETDGCRHTVSGPVDWFDEKVGQGASRHDKITAALPWAFSEAMAGCYSARAAFESLYAAYAAKFSSETEPDRVAQLGDEYMRIAKWAAAQADPDRAHRSDDVATDAELEAFWTSRPELQRLRTFARARCVGPWSMLGAVLASVVATIPPYVVLPATVGSEASLNLFVALVARSGFGKNASEAGAEDFVASDTNVFVATPGSGEGILKQYAYVKKPKGQEPQQINLRNAVMFTVGEVDTFAALAGRSGSTLMPELRKAWMGERLGFGWATAEKAVVVMPHRYRMTMVVGVQPGRGGALLQDADGGTPQRFIWLPTTDADAPDEPPDEPEPLSLPTWPTTGDEQVGPAGSGTPDDGPTLKFGPRLDEYKLDVPPDKSAFHVLGLPPSVVGIVRREQLSKLRGEVPEREALDAHATLARLKVAVGLMWMNGRTDKVTEEDWDLAGVVMRVSNATRGDVQSALRGRAVAVSHERGRQEAEREEAKEGHKYEKAIARVSERIREKLRANNGQPKAKLKRQFGRDKEYVDEALARLVAVGDVELEAVEYRGNPGHIVLLKEGR